MGLQLRVLNPGDCSAIEGETRICEGSAFTIGRGPDNDWVLLDAQRYLSKHHCRIELTGDGYRVVDISTNGVYLGDAPAPIGRGNAKSVADGDILNLGSCIVRIEIAAPPSLRPVPAPAVPDSFQIPHPAPFDDSAVPPRFEWSDRLGDDHGEATDPFGPIAGLAQPDAEFHDPGDLTLSQSASTSDNPGLTSAYFRAPEILRPSIPTDWQADVEETPEPPVAEFHLPPAPIEVAPARPQPIVDAPPTRITASPPPPPAVAITDANARALIDAFLDGAALPIEAFDMTDPVNAMRKVGQAFREAVGGLRELLESRAMLKAEFRLEHTLVRARDNNPLKFSTNLDGSLAVLLGRRVPGFMEAPEAIRESVRDVKAHEIAIMAGLKAALAGQLEQFSPANLRAQVEKNGGGGILPHVKKARLWERFEDLHEQMSTEQISASPVGGQFSTAYSAQYRKI
jgi:type VI secretion system FHA domain protein